MREDVSLNVVDSLVIWIFLKLIVGTDSIVAGGSSGHLINETKKGIGYYASRAS